MSSKATFITKASGASVPFSENKLAASLMRAGATKTIAHQITANVKEQLYPGIATRKIYKLAFALLKKQEKPLAARYKLKQAIMQLGPSGFPFELYIARLLSHQGLKVEIGQKVIGKCADHEIDVIATNNESKYMIECKYHNRPGLICDVKIPLYIQSRFLDVQFTWQQQPAKNKMICTGWVVTNTRFTADAIQYGTCAGLRLIGWDYPLNGNLRQMIDKSGLYPITCLTTLSKSEKQLLLDNKIVLVSEVIKNIDLFKQHDISISHLENILRETAALSTPAININQ